MQCIEFELYVSGTSNIIENIDFLSFTHLAKEMAKIGYINAQNFWYKFSNQPIEDIKMFKDDNSVKEIIG